MPHTTSWSSLKSSCSRQKSRIRRECSLCNHCYTKGSRGECEVGDVGPAILVGDDLTVAGPRWIARLFEELRGYQPFRGFEPRGLQNCLNGCSRAADDMEWMPIELMNPPDRSARLPPTSRWSGTISAPLRVPLRTRRLDGLDLGPATRSTRAIIGGATGVEMAGAIAEPSRQPASANSTISADQSVRETPGLSRLVLC
jgi:hypothetical protein